MLYACKGAHTLFISQREREKKREREKERVLTGALAPFSYLVLLYKPRASIGAL